MNSKWVKLTNVGGWTHFLLRSPWRISTVSFCSHNPVLLLLVQLLIHLWIRMGSGDMRGCTFRRRGPTVDDSERDVFASGDYLMSLVSAPWRMLVAQIVWNLPIPPKWKKKSPLFLKPFYQSKQINKQKGSIYYMPWLSNCIDKDPWGSPLWQWLHYTQTFL